MVVKIKNKKHKKIKELIDKISLNFLNKISFILLSVWMMFPILVMILNIFYTKEFVLEIMYNALSIIGICGISVGIIYILKKIYKGDFKKKIDYKKYLPIIILLIILLWCFISCFTSIDILRSLGGSYYRKDGYFSYILYFGILLLSIMLEAEDKKYLLYELLVVEIIMAIISLINNDLTHTLMHNQEAYDGIFCQFNHYGYYLMFGIMSSLFLFLNEQKKIKILFLLSYILLLYTLIKNDTFGCFVAITFTLFLITIYYRKNIKKILPILLAFILVCSLTFKNGQNVVLNNLGVSISDAKKISTAIEDKNADNINSIGTTRGMLWRYAIKASIKKPITGYGIENIEQYYTENKINTDRPHNVLIQFTAFTGIPGMILYVLFIFTIIKRGFGKIKKLQGIDLLAFFMVICYITSSMFGNSMFYTSPYYFIFLGFLMPHLFYLKKDKKNLSC